jgi:hypothetical protein
VRMVSSDCNRRSAALARSTSRAKSVTELAAQRRMTDASIRQFLPLTCLAPDILEAILDGRQPKGLRLVELLGNGPLHWEEQRVSWRFGSVARATGGTYPETELSG